MEGTSGGVAGGGGSKVEIMSTTFQIDHKIFHFDLKENTRGRYLKISEKTSSTSSTILVPSSDISLFVDLFDYYDDSEEDKLFSKEVQLGSKVFYFDIVENRRGRFLKKHRSVEIEESFFVPEGSYRYPREGWSTFSDILDEIHKASKRFIMPTQEHLIGDDVGAGFIPSHGSQSPSSSELIVDQASDDETGMTEVSKVIRADQKRFFFDLGRNNSGHFLKISEVAGSDRSTIVLPLSGLKQFHEAIGHFVEITKDKIEGMTGPNVRTIDPPHVLSVYSFKE